MKYFHGGISNGAVLRTHLPHVVRVMLNAYRLSSEPKVLRRNLRYAVEVFLDSGMISAFIAGDLGWIERQQKIVDLSHYLKVDYVAMLDLPMIPALLKGKMPPVEALQMTFENASRFADADVYGQKVYTLQGYQMDAYRLSLWVYRQLGVFDQDCWIAIGSIKRRSLERLTEIVGFVRRECPNHHIHAFGVAGDEKLLALKNLGVDSVDSGRAAYRATYSEGGDWSSRFVREVKLLESQVGVQRMPFDFYL